MEKKLYYTLLVLLIIVIAALAVFAITPPNGHEVSQLDLTPITIVGDDVGIGTTNPDGQLDLFGKLKSQGSSTGTHSTGWRMDVEGGSDWAILSTGSTYPSGPNKLVFFDEAAGANRMVIDSLGNIGIGTTDPAAPLHILGVGDTPIRLENSERLAVINNDIDSKNFEIRFPAGSSSNVRFSIDALGNIGMGTQTPETRLDLGGGTITMGYFHNIKQCGASNVCEHTCPSGQFIIGGGTRCEGGGAIQRSYAVNARSWISFCQNPVSRHDVSIICANIR